MVNTREVQYELYYLAGAAGGCILSLIIWNIYLTCRVKWLEQKIRENVIRGPQKSSVQTEFEIPRPRVNTPDNFTDNTSRRFDFTNNKNNLKPIANNNTFY